MTPCAWRGVAWRGKARENCVLGQGGEGKRDRERHGEREAARNRRERLAVGRSVEAQRVERSPSLESRVFHDERAHHTDRGGKRDRGGSRGRGARGLEARYAM